MTAMGEAAPEPALSRAHVSPRATDVILENAEEAGKSGGSCAHENDELEEVVGDADRFEDRL